MVWLFDGGTFATMPLLRDRHTIARFAGNARQTLRPVSAAVYIDLGWIGFFDEPVAPERPSGGWGADSSTAPFVEWLTKARQHGREVTVKERT
jgi:hypothetical protein